MPRAGWCSTDSKYASCASSEYAFDLPRARGEVQPSLALTYNSSRGAGYAGVGWTLDTSSITRKGVSGLPRFTDPVLSSPNTPDVGADEYVMDGHSLIPICQVSAQSCGNLLPGEVLPSSTILPTASGPWTYFRRDVADGARYFLSHFGATWVVQWKSGRVQTYGEPLDSQFHLGIGIERAQNSVVSFNNIYRWNLVRDTDASGNTVYYVWQTFESLFNIHSPVSGLLYVSDIYDTLAPHSATADPTRFAHHVHLSWQPRDGFLYKTAPMEINSPVWRASPFARLATVDVTAAPSMTTMAPRQFVRRYVLDMVPSMWQVPTWQASLS